MLSCSDNEKTINEHGLRSKNHHKESIIVRTNLQNAMRQHNHMRGNKLYVARKELKNSPRTSQCNDLLELIKSLITLRAFTGMPGRFTA